MKKSSSASFSVSEKRTVAIKKIPRPMNCFMTFRVEKQKEILDKCPGANHRDISKIVAKWWRDFPDHKKEPYRAKAALAKTKHLEEYPDYKYRPQKKTYTTRPYKKRPENEFTARDYQNKHQLFSLYHEGKLSDSNYDSDCLLDEKPEKKTKRNSKQLVSKNPMVKTQQELYSIYSTNDHNTKFVVSQSESPCSTALLYPPVNDMIYNCGSSDPSQSVYSPSASPYSVGYFTDSEVSVNEPMINYQLYSENYGFTQPILPLYSVPSHFNTFDQFCEFDNALMYTSSSSCHPLDISDTYLGYQVDNSAPVPSLLTTPFYYQ
ncbi:hypothetical protein INT47_006097 [Mucor saturninus]|uniref:HMG box domain-containing protein n=1 Tax=Mucor saturninus TaxID=64648 RepID=A0A8H7RDH1_9FUNG|nr:hypothetical protein INT47_006097 [Mucor saturninus]